MTHASNDQTHEFLLEYCYYSDAGYLYWSKGWFKGRRLGSSTNRAKGGNIVAIQYKRVFVHRLIWPDDTLMRITANNQKNDTFLDRVGRDKRAYDAVPAKITLPRLCLYLSTMTDDDKQRPGSWHGWPSGVGLWLR